MPAGRPTLYREEHADTARRLCLLGLTDEELAEFFGVHPDTIYEWDRVHPEFSEARARGKERADAKVAERLYHRALGYHHPDVHVSSYEGAITLTPVTKHYPPDTQAATWWLKNRRGKNWRDKSEIEHSGEVGIVATEPMTEEEWAQKHAAGVGATGGSSTCTG